jgi:hypothetical protein
MKIQKIALILLIGVLTTLILLFILWISGGFDTELYQSIIRTILPLNGILITSVVTYFSLNVHSENKRTVGEAEYIIPKFISYIVYAYFLLINIVSIYKATGLGGNILSDTMFLNVLASIEVVFGASLGVSIKKIFSNE